MKATTGSIGVLQSLVSFGAVNIAAAVLSVLALVKDALTSFGMLMTITFDVRKIIELHKKIQEIERRGDPRDADRLKALKTDLARRILGIAELTGVLVISLMSLGLLLSMWHVNFMAFLITGTVISVIDIVGKIIAHANKKRFNKLGADSFNARMQREKDAATRQARREKAQEVRDLQVQLDDARRQEARAAGELQAVQDRLARVPQDIREAHGQQAEALRREATAVERLQRGAQETEAQDKEFAS